ncbi:hypothetical protein BJ742DRAFT_766174 [Cladochytrium replicatum]|nr:hypothetical protein BJ742DRAFT_766174 [Cladochytrium replicatum]
MPPKAHQSIGESSVPNQGGKGFSYWEVKRILDLVEEMRPIGAFQWDNVAVRYNTNLPAKWIERSADQLKRKFYTFKNTRKLTEDPIYSS